MLVVSLGLRNLRPLYHLFRSLAVADLAIGLISMPLFTVSALMGYWPLGPHVCDAWLTLDYLNSNASVLNLLIISFDRYFSVTRPLTYRAKRTTNRAAIMIGKSGAVRAWLRETANEGLHVRVSFWSCTDCQGACHLGLPRPRAGPLSPGSVAALVEADFRLAGSAHDARRFSRVCPTCAGQ